MSNDQNQELIIVNAISQMVIPTDVFEKSEFKEVIKNFKSAQKNVTDTLDSVDSARSELKSGSFIGNWWKNRKDKLQDAQLDLSTSIGLLTKYSSDLILFNTAISKVLVSQQNVLHEQQELLKEQASELDEQNKLIKEQQVKLSEQQEKLLEVNQGLLEAKGITREHAEKLVGCVRRVELSEQKMEESNQRLKLSVLERIVVCEEQAESIKTNLEDTLINFRKEQSEKFEEVIMGVDSELNKLKSLFSSLNHKIASESDARTIQMNSLKNELLQLMAANQKDVKDKEESLRSEILADRNNFSKEIAELNSKLNVFIADNVNKYKKIWYYLAPIALFSLSSVGGILYLTSLAK